MTKSSWILTALMIACPTPEVAAQETWLELTSDHYRLAGNVDSDDLEDVAVRFEAFHSALSEMFNPRQYPELRPVVVVVVDEEDTLEGLGLIGDDGYFLRGEREHYVAMLTESNRRRPFDRVLHDYFHAVAREAIPNAPIWLEEGLAEFYRTATWSEDGDQLQIGRPIDSFVRSVRDREGRLSFDELFSVVQDSDSYDEMNREDVFHAQSWALVHYLITLNQGQGYAQTIRFVRSMASRDAFEDAVQSAFGLSFRSLLADFEDRAEERGTYPYLTLAAADSSRGIARGEPRAISFAETETHMAELLIRRGEIDQAETRLRAAIGTDPEALAPKLSLSRLLVDSGRPGDARLVLETEIEKTDTDALSHYYYALTLLSPGEPLDSSVRNQARGALREAIRLDPELADAYHELARSYLSAEEGGSGDDDLDEAVDLLETALRLKPRNPEYRFSLSGALIERERFADARTVLLPLVDEIQRPDDRSRALSVLQSIESLDGNAGVRGEGFAEITRDASQSEDDQPVGVSEDLSAPTPAFDRFELTRIVAGDQQRGVLSLVDCRDGLTLSVEADSGTYLFHTDAPDRVEFATFTSDVGAELRCGPLDPPLPVVITFQEAPEGSEFIGVPNRVEFVP